MRSRPNALELIDIAEKTLSGEVAPDLSVRQRYNVALIASALGIAQRELAGASSAWPGERAALEALCGPPPNGAGFRARNRAGIEAGNEAADVALDRLNRKFAAELRAGRFDAQGRDRKAAMELLRNDVVARLAEDNPRYVK